MAIRRTVFALLLAAGEAAAVLSESAACHDKSASCAQSESIIEALEAAEVSLMDVQLLQTKVGIAAAVLSPSVAVGDRLPMASLAVLADGPEAMEDTAEGLPGAEPSRVDADVDVDIVSTLQAKVVLTTDEVPAFPSPQIHHSAFSPQVLQGAIPAAAIVIGFILTQNEHCRILGLLSVYFGVQTGLNLYMKVVLSNAVISHERGMKGIPGAFLITALQQLVSFALLVPTLLILWPTRWRYTPKPLTTGKAVAGVLGLSVTFALNIGLNNLCLSLLPMSMNLMIRSCIPLAAWMMQSLVSCCIPDLATNSKPAEVGFMVLGVIFAALASIAKQEGSHGNEAESKDMVAGVLIGVASLVACSLYLIFAQMLGQDVKMNPIDMTLYMSVPAALFLVPLMFLHHPVGWKGFTSLSDWQVLHEVMNLSPLTMFAVALSGVFALFYNTFQYAMVSELSATHTAFAGNFNKAATITLSLLLGMETLPSQPWGSVCLASIVGGVASFTAYSIVKVDGGKSGKH